MGKSPKIDKRASYYYYNPNSSKKGFQWVQGQIFFRPPTLTGHSFAAPRAILMAWNWKSAVCEECFEKKFNCTKISSATKSYFFFGIQLLFSRHSITQIDLTNERLFSLDRLLLMATYFVLVQPLFKIVYKIQKIIRFIEYFKGFQKRDYASS